MGLPKPPEFPSNPLIALACSLLGIAPLQLPEVQLRCRIDTICREILARGVLLRL
jgi:hypothetical protein